MGGEESKFGYQVSRVIPKSPAHIAGLLPFFDFIIAVDGIYIEDDGSFFRDYLKTHNGQPIAIDVYNAKTKTVRRIRIVPNDRWGGAGLLGCCIMWENIESAYVCSWHILDVAPNSNAERAGLQPHRDYIIGMQGTGSSDDFCTMFTDEQDFEQRLSHFLSAAQDPQSTRFRDFTVLFLVYDSIENSIREVMSNIPLGCEVGGGYMHTIPSSKGDQRLPTMSEPNAKPQTASKPSSSVSFTNPAQDAYFYGGPPSQVGSSHVQQAAKLRPTSPTSSAPPVASPAAIPHQVPNPYAPNPSLGGFGIGQVNIQLQE